VALYAWRPRRRLVEFDSGRSDHSVQLRDATAQVPESVSLAFDGLHNRRAPSDGEFPIDEIVEVLRQSGGLNIVGLEIFSQEFDRMPADAIGERSRAIHYRALLTER
jgi:hypothetical protein